MFFTLEKLERNTKQLKDLRYRERMEIPSFDASTPEEEPVGKRPESVVYTGTLKKGDFWIGRHLSVDPTVRRDPGGMGGEKDRRAF